MSDYNTSMSDSGCDGKGRKWRTESLPEITAQYFEGREVAEKTPYFPSKSLEYYIEKDEMFRSKHDRAITLNTCPVFLREAILHLQGRKQQLKTIADVSRCTTDCGIVVLERMRAPRDLRKLRRRIFHRGNETLMSAFSELHINPLSKASSRTCRFNVYVYEDVRGRIGEQEMATGLSLSACTELALMGGLSQAEGLIPSKYKTMFVAALREFVVKIERRVMEMQELIHRKGLEQKRYGRDADE